MEKYMKDFILAAWFDYLLFYLKTMISAMGIKDGD